MRHADANEIFESHKAEMSRIDKITDIHELWYDWLKTTDEKKWSERVKAWFGDCSIPYAEWQKEHEENFHDEKQEVSFFFQEIKDEDDYRSNRLDPADDDGSSIILFVNMWNSKRDLVKAFRQLLKERHPGKRGKPKIDQWAEFPLAMYPDERVMKSLKRTLKVYRLSETVLHNYEIGELLKFKVRDENSDKHSLSTHVRKYIKRAELLQKNVMNGIFPAKFPAKEKGHPM